MIDHNPVTLTLLKFEVTSVNLYSLRGSVAYVVELTTEEGFEKALSIFSFYNTSTTTLENLNQQLLSIITDIDQDVDDVWYEVIVNDYKLTRRGVEQFGSSSGS